MSEAEILVLQPKAAVMPNKKKEEYYLLNFQIS